ncbi:unnamed protein product [Paramecium sonneborni]|uniref:Uncharacterized protein n=1 Tax=Paramecium sonneborni TaxID=65129 RepID=A0A8S1N8P0_9CILI|nr:unnamed protein product [Paramecium sonneborni]
MRFLYCDSNVTPEMKEKIKKLLFGNADKLNHQNPALFLQQLLNKNFEKLWFVYVVYSPVELEYQIRSNTQILIDIEIEKTRYILAQFEEVSVGTFSKDKFIKTCQQIEKNIQQQSHDLNTVLHESLKYLEYNFGSSSHMILIKCNEQETQLQFNGPNQNQYIFKTPISALESIQGGIFYIPLGAEEDEGMQEFHHGKTSEEEEEEFDNNQIRDENYIQDEYEEPMDLQFQVMLDPKDFRQSTDQVKVSFDELEIQPLKLHSFSILFQIIISPFPKEIKDDLNVLSTGSSLMSKNMTFGINRDQLFFFNFQLMTGKMETLYSQMKIKRNQQYQIALVYTETETYKEVSMYINGAIENQINLSQQLEPPRGFFWIGSEQALKLFKGTLWDIVFIAQALHQKHIKSIYAELQSALSHKFQRKSMEIVDEILQQFKEEIPIDQDESKFTHTQSLLKQQSKTMTKGSNKKLQIPSHLQKSYHVFEEIDKKKQQQQEQPLQKTIQEFASRLKQLFVQNEILYHKCHELSLNFYWIFTTVQQLAPPLEENGSPKLPFEYIHQELFKERFETYPYYAIEFDRFCKVVQHSGIQLSHDDIYQLADITESLRENKRFGYYLIYDRLLLSIRQAALTEQEIEEVKSQYNTDEKEADQDLIIYTRGISRSKQAQEHNFSFFEQLKVLVGSENEAFKYNIQYLLAYFVNNDEFVQKLTAVYIHKETGQEVEIEGVDLFSYDQDKIFQQKLDISEETQPKYFRVHYNGENMAMISFKTHEAEETFRIDKTFIYREGQDATGQLETYAFEQQRLAGFRGKIVRKDDYSQIIMLAAEYLQKDPKVEEQKRNQPETLPQLPENWNQGKFQLIINRCSDCDKHKTTTWHYEADFASKFNEIGQILKDMFPNIEIIGNWDKTQQLEHFDVYIRGVGQLNQMDKEGRVFLFKKNEKLAKFLDCFLKRMLKVYDDIVLIAQAYGDTNYMASKQEQFLKSNNYSQRSKISHDHPCNVPDKQEKSEKGEAQLAGMDFICKNWGCGQPFKYDSTPNGIKTCKHHPGRYEFGSKHGLWPECWTCCGKKWEAEGCRLAYHKGVPEKDFYNICINVGPLDSKTGYPEGTCGMRFQDGDSSESEETFRIDKTFIYREGQDATGQLETYAFEQQRLAGFRGKIVRKDDYSQIIMLAAEYLQKDPKVEEQKRNQPETLPQLPENWNQGKFQLIINRCSDCDKHKTTTWHYEADFASKFNEIGQILKDMFPNIEIIGNWDKTQQLEHFDVYIRGVGQLNQMDKEGRVFLFRKNEKLAKFLDCFLKRMLKVYDDIVLIAQAYGDTNYMASKQEQFLKSNNYSQRSKISHDHPCNVPDKQEKSEKGEAQLAGMDFICKNWGCGQPFKYDSTPNGIKTCKHHPGRYEFGSKHGLWPECWTCCGKKWEAEGCRLAYHKGVPEKDFYNICINVGPLDSKTGYPEGTCGMRFQDGDSSECKYNSGTHQAAKWPDPAAKVYFVQKIHTNPAQKEKETQPNKNIQLRPDVFRETKPYNEFINKDRQRQMKLIETEKELRTCTNWACGKQYREIENRKKRMCKCHPGVFDFGHTATKIQEAIEEYKQDKGSKILWRPHWTCCRKSWNEPGCTLQQHSGPLVVEYKPNKYQWPDPKAQIYFKKKVSENWTRMLEQHHNLTPETASLKYDLLCKTLGSGGLISAYRLPELCDKFELNLWVCSEDLAFQFKFTDIMEGRAQEYLADTSGNIDKHKFLDWWFADVNRMLEISQK